MARGPVIARAIAAFLFVALFAAVLTIPIRSSDNGSPERRTVETPSESLPASPSPSPSRKPIPHTLRFATAYPRVCLRPVGAPPESLIAAYSGKRVTIVTAGGEVRATIEHPAPIVRPPIAWSPSGRFVAAGPQGIIWTADGRSILSANGEFDHGIVWLTPKALWGWSPIADCGLSVEDGALLVSSVDPAVTGLGLELLHRRVGEFAFSPDGRKLALGLSFGISGALGIADLGTGRINVFAGVCCTPLGWTPDGETLLYYRPQGPSLDADGIRVRGLSLAGRRFDFGTHVTTRSIDSCGDTPIVSVSGWRDVTDHARLGFLRPGQDPLFITDGRPSYMDATCSHDGSLIAAVRTPVLYGSGRFRWRDLLARRIVLLDEDGDPIRTIADDAAYGDDYPDWGPPGTGLMFIRITREAPHEVWFVPEGSSPRFAGVEVTEPGYYYGAYAWQRVVDWSATPPTGLPAGY